MVKGCAFSVCPEFDVTDALERYHPVEIAFPVHQESVTVMPVNKAGELWILNHKLLAIPQTDDDCPAGGRGLGRCLQHQQENQFCNQHLCPFNCERHAHSAADTQRGQAVTPTPFVQFVDESRDES